MIRVTNLRKNFRRFRAVNNITFTVDAGQAVALWGADGAGKTTVIRCVLGLLPYRGRITVAEHNIRRRGKAARRLIGYVPQELALYDDFRLPEALSFFARLKRADPMRVPIVLNEVGLAEHRRKRIRELSGGMKQRMALAVALLSDPPVLVLDELTSNLDAAAQGGFMSLLSRLKEKNKTILFTSHHLAEVESLADRVLVMDSGNITSECAAENLAETLGVQCVLKIFTVEDVLERALRVLLDEGFTATRNGRSLSVRVPANRKTAPLLSLGRANIDVQDFDVLDDAAGEFVEGEVSGD